MSLSKRQYHANNKLGQEILIELDVSFFIRFENFDCNGLIFRKFSGIAKKLRTSTAYVEQNGVLEIVQQRECQLRIKRSSLRL